MPELTQRQLNAITTTAKNVATMANAVSKTAKAVASMAEDVRDIKTDVHTTHATVEMHTTTLDGISKNISTLLIEKAAIAERFARYDRFMEIVAEKLKFDLKTLD